MFKTCSTTNYSLSLKSLKIRWSFFKHNTICFRLGNGCVNKLWNNTLSFQRFERLCSSSGLTITRLKWRWRLETQRGSYEFRLTFNIYGDKKLLWSPSTTSPLTSAMFYCFRVIWKKLFILCVVSTLFTNIYIFIVKI